MEYSDWKNLSKEKKNDILSMSTAKLMFKSKIPEVIALVNYFYTETELNGDDIGETREIKLETKHHKNHIKYRVLELEYKNGKKEFQAQKEIVFTNAQPFWNNLGQVRTDKQKSLQDIEYHKEDYVVKETVFDIE